jgi:hypothetical protein
LHGTDEGGGIVVDPPASCRYRQPSFVHHPVWANLWHMPVDGLVPVFATGLTCMDVSESLSLSSSDESTLRCSKMQLPPNLQPSGVLNHLHGTDEGGEIMVDPPASCRYRQPSFVHRPVWANLWHMPVDGLVSVSVAVSVAVPPATCLYLQPVPW